MYKTRIDLLVPPDLASETRRRGEIHNLSNHGSGRSHAGLATAVALGDLDAGHYFFVPQVELSNGDFLWLPAPKRIVAPGTPFPPDLHSWIRNGNLAPDWLRIGTDITHQGPFNAAFSLQGAAVPEPASWTMMIGGFGAVGFVARRKRQAKTATA